MYRKLIQTILCLILSVLLLGSSLGFADNIVVGSGSGSSANGYINSMSVSFRSGPGTGYSVLHIYNTGKQIEIISSASGWTKCKIDGLTGYVLSDFVSENATAPVVTPAPTATPTPTPTTAPSSVIPTPDTDSGSSSDNGKGNTVVIGGNKNKNPFTVSTPKVSATPSPSVTPASKPTATPVSSAVPSSTPTSASVSNTSNSASKTGTITGDYVRFRTGPSTSYSIIASYNNGTAVTVTGTSNDWTACTIDGKNGFVFSKYIQVSSSDDTSARSEAAASPSPSVVPTATPTATPSAGTAVTKAGYICGNNVRFRSGPSTSSEIIGEFYYANAVTITGTSGDWTAVSADGKSGYVFSTYVKEGTYTAAESSKNEADSGSAAASGSGSDVVSYAMQYLGTKYTWGGSSPETGFDCSGFVYYVYKHFGVTLNRIAQDQASNGTHVDASDLQPGDILCFYSSGSYIGHSGIYIGDGKFIHSCNSNTGVIITELSGSYAYRSYEARRIF